jgi:hypothetical protein
VLSAGTAGVGDGDGGWAAGEGRVRAGVGDVRRSSSKLTVRRETEGGRRNESSANSGTSLLPSDDNTEELGFLSAENGFSPAVPENDCLRGAGPLATGLLSSRRSRRSSTSSSSCLRGAGGPDVVTVGGRPEEVGRGAVMEAVLGRGAALVGVTETEAGTDEALVVRETGTWAGN